MGLHDLIPAQQSMAGILTNLRKSTNHFRHMNPDLYGQLLQSLQHAIHTNWNKRVQNEVQTTLTFIIKDYQSKSNYILKNHSDNPISMRYVKEYKDIIKTFTIIKDKVTRQSFRAHSQTNY